MLSFMASSLSEKREPAFFARSPEKIKHARQPPCIEKKYEETPTQEYANSQHIEWTDSMLVTPSVRDTLWKNQTHVKKAISSIEERLHEPLDSLVICDINPEIGKGVFLAHDAKPLPIGTVIGIYAGELDSSDSDYFEEKEDDYVMSLTSDEHEPSVVSQTIPRLRVSGKKKRNITAFIQDAPGYFSLNTLNQIQEVSGKPFAKENIATANIFVQPVVYKGCPTSYLVTVREIMPGEQLLFPYQNYGKGNY